MVVIYFPFLQLHPSRGPPKLISLFRSLLLSLQLHFSSLSSLSSSENIRKREDYSTENTQWKFITSMKFLFCEYTGWSSRGAELMLPHVHDAIPASQFQDYLLLLLTTTYITSILWCGTSIILLHSYSLYLSHSFSSLYFIGIFLCFVSVSMLSFFLLFPFFYSKLVSYLRSSVLSSLISPPIASRPVYYSSSCKPLSLSATYLHFLSILIPPLYPEITADRRLNDKLQVAFASTVKLYTKSYVTELMFVCFQNFLVSK